jgi:hypothetical protein
MRRLALLVLLAPAAALAHATSISYSELSVDGSTVRGELRFSLPDLQTQGPVDPARLDPALLRPLVLDPFVISQDGKPCALAPEVVARMDGPDGVTLQASWTCPAPVRTFAVRVGFIDSFPLGHTHLSRVVLGPGEVAQRVAQADSPSFEVTASSGGTSSSGAPRFALLGLMHIWLGPEHLAFLLALVLLCSAAGEGRGARAAVEPLRVVTAFTLAHSIAVLLSALGPLALPARPLDLLLGLLVAAAGLENLWALRNPARAVHALERRWVLASVLGAVHGLGFSGVLPRASLASGMLPFSLGLEAGQVALLAAAWPLRGWLRPRVARAGSAAAVVLALLWLAARLR